MTAGYAVDSTLVLNRDLRFRENSSVGRAWAVFTTHHGYADLTPTQYGTAFSWLREVGAVRADGSLALKPGAAGVAVFEAALLGAAPLWLPDADQLVTTFDDLPADAAAAAEALGLGPTEAISAVRTAWAKVSTAAREAVGAAGEKALIQLLQSVPDTTVAHVAAYADGLGYDLTVERLGRRANVEVKTTTRRGRLTFYLSRNEFAIMGIDPDWRLAVLLLDPNCQAEAVGVVPSAWIAQHAPADTSAHGRWESVRLDVPVGIVQAGIGAIGLGVEECLAARHVLRSGSGEHPPAWLELRSA